MGAALSWPPPARFSPLATLPPATAPRRSARLQPMLRIDPSTGRIEDRRLADLPGLVGPGDVLVLNDAATLPASLSAFARRRELELRLLGERRDGVWAAVLFGEGSWREDTDTRPAPPALGVGEAIELGGGLRAVVEAVDPISPRLLEVRFEPGGDGFWRLLYALGRPVQYSYLDGPLPLGAVQTPYASRPWAVEMPSAGRALSAELLAGLRDAGAEVVTLTHAAGLSATGDPTLDARLPLPERYSIGEGTAAAVRRARRVIAVGTSVTRALEGVARSHGAVVAAEGVTDLRIGARTELRVVDAILTGAHDPTSSHHSLLEAFASRSLLARALRASIAGGYRGHELGDSWLIG